MATQIEDSEKVLFKAGTIVVLLSCVRGRNIWAPQIPVNHIYKLREDCTKNKFLVDQDLHGSRRNGWSYYNYYGSKLEVRRATTAEVYLYECKGPIETSPIPLEKGMKVKLHRFFDGPGFTNDMETYIRDHDGVATIKCFASNGWVELIEEPHVWPPSACVPQEQETIAKAKPSLPMEKY